MTYLTSDFDFSYPEELVAHQPLAERDQSRLLVRTAAGRIAHRSVQDLPDILPSGSVVVVNDSRVIPARILGEFATGGRFEIMLLSSCEDLATDNTCTWDAVGKPMRKLLARQRAYLPDGVIAAIQQHPEHSRQIRVTFNLARAEFAAWLDRHGYIPLPPYIKRESPLPAGTSPDRERYQTVFANQPGSVAAPTAGLHFTGAIRSRMQANGITIVPVTLHVGGGTFLPVQSDLITEHDMHTEYYYLSRTAVEAIMNALNAERSIFALGTTSFRAVESFWEDFGDHFQTAIDAADRWHGTRLFIHPQKPESLYEPHVFSGLLTNFHQPKSTLYMLICALLGIDNAARTYREAIEQRYRLFSYGDTSLLFLE